jgi:predicted aconitase with swiveling domain
MERVIRADPLVAGKAAGELLVSPEPLSFWGGYNHETGEIIDRRHPLSGRIAARRVFALPFSRGSSTTTAILLEAIRAGTAPAAILTTDHDSFFALASIVADELLASPIPILSLQAADFSSLRTGDFVTIREDGTITVRMKDSANRHSADQGQKN